MAVFDVNGSNLIPNGNVVFTGKTASFYGDSLTEVNQHYTKGYHSWVKDILGLTSYNNYGVSGYTIARVITKMQNTTDNPDIVFVMVGVNDENFSTPLGQFGDTTTATIYGGYDVLCNLIKTKYPSKLCILITPHYQTRYPHSSGVTSYEVSKAMIEVATKYAIPVYNNFVYSGIYTTNLNIWTVDNCHWNNKAHEMVGKNLSEWVLTHFEYLYVPN